jgi:hypothetical protein
MQVNIYYNKWHRAPIRRYYSVRFVQLRLATLLWLVIRDSFLSQRPSYVMLQCSLGNLFKFLLCVLQLPEHGILAVFHVIILVWNE